MSIERSHCPVCKSENIFFSIKAKDHTVSLEEFDIWQCNSCSVRFTQGIPSKDDIVRYYNSENYISHSDTSKGLINSLYHKVRKRTLLSKKKLIQNYTSLKTGKILDVGCGTGSFLNTMYEGGWSTTGLEPDSSAREKAKELYGLNLLESTRLFSQEKESFDAITLWHVLEHVHDLQEYIAQLKILLKPDGNLFIAVPNYTSFDARLYKSFWAAYDVPRHLYHFSPESMEKLLDENGLKLAGTKPMLFDSFYVSMLSEKYKNGKLNIVKALWSGLLSDIAAFGNIKKCSSVIYVIKK